LYGKNEKTKNMNKKTECLISPTGDADGWDCPTCGRPTPPEIDVECHCGMMASHHVSISTMCKRLREAQQRESALLVEVIEQSRLLGMSAERESALRGEIERERCLADRLGDALLSTLSCWMTSPDAEQAAKSLAAWKEARSEIRN
jgi:hypothetical protein